MKNRLWIIIAAVALAVAVAAALFFLLGRDTVSTESGDGPFACAYQQTGKSVKVTITGQFSKNSWIAESGNEEILAVTTLKNAKKAATFQISPVAGGMESAYFTFSAAGSEYDGYEVIADVQVDEEGKVNFVTFRQRQGKQQNFSGSTGEFDYICRSSKSGIEVVLTAEKPVEWVYEIEEDSFLTIESAVIQEMTAEEPAAANESGSQQTATGSSAAPAQAEVSDGEAVTKTDNDEILEQMAQLGYSESDLQNMEEEEIFTLIGENYPESVGGSETAGYADETEEITDEASGSTETHFIFTANGTGDEELVRLCSSSLTKALEITVQGSMDGVLEITEVKEVNYTYYELPDTMQARMDAYALIGADALPDGFTATDYAINTVGEAQVVSFTATINGADWNYQMSKECSADMLAENTLGNVLQEYAIKWSGMDVTVYTLEDGIAASWQREDLGCLLYRTAKTIAYGEDGEAIVEILTQQEAVFAASTAIANLGKEVSSNTAAETVTENAADSQTALTEKSVP